MRKTKRCLFPFALYDRSGIQSYLEKQAWNGWMLDTDSDRRFSFHQIDPVCRHFAVTYLPQNDEESIAHLRELCSKDGWIHLLSDNGMQIFYNDGENPVPIDTDPVVEVDTIHRCMIHFWKQNRLALLAKLILFVLSIVRGIAMVAAGNIVVGTISFCALCFFIGLRDIVSFCVYSLWHIKAKTLSVTEGTFLQTKHPPLFFHACVNLFGIVYALILAVLLVVACLLLKASAWICLIVAIIAGSYSVRNKMPQVIPAYVVGSILVLLIQMSISPPDLIPNYEQIDSVLGIIRSGLVFLFCVCVWFASKARYHGKFYYPSFACSCGMVILRIVRGILYRYTIQQISQMQDAARMLSIVNTNAVTSHLLSTSIQLLCIAAMILLWIKSKDKKSFSNTRCCA